MTIKAVDLFCGVGGLTYGLQKAGIPVVAGIDIDDSCEYAYTTAHLFIKALKMSQEKKYAPFCEALTLKYSSDVRHVNLFQAIKKISKTVLNIKTGNYYTNLGGWWKKLVPT